MAEKMVVVQHPKTGESYAMTMADFRSAKVEAGGTKSREEVGFKAVSLEDGSPIDPPKVRRGEDPPRPDAAADVTGEARGIAVEPDAEAEAPKGKGKG